MNSIARRRAVGVLAAVTATAAARPLRAQTAAPVVRIGTILADSFAQPFYALDGGFLDRAGIAGQVTVFPGSGAISTAVAAGAIDVGLCDAVAIANGIIHHVPFAAIAGSGVFRAAEPTGLLCVDTSSTLKEPKELEGKSIAVPSLGSLTTIAIQEWLVQSQADPNAVKFIELPFPQVAAALARGTVAAGYIGEPVLLTALATTSKTFANPYASLGPQVLICNWVTTREWVAKNHDVARRFVAAMSDTAAWANVHRDLTAPMLAKYSKIDLERIKAMRRASYATSLDPKMLQSTLDAAVRFKAIARPVTIAELQAKS